MTAGDERFVAAYERFYRHVYAYCRRRSNADQVDDVVAEVFLVAWRRIGELPDGEAALAWLYGVAYRVLGHQFRGLRRRTRLDRKLASIGVEPTRPAHDFVLQRHESRQALEALSRLREGDQEILRLSVWEELSYEEISTVLDLSVDAARQRLSRAKRSLTREYERLDRRRVNSPAAQKGGAW